jgi:hypothetical protein
MRGGISGSLSLGWGVDTQLVELKSVGETPLGKLGPRFDSDVNAGPRAEETAAGLVLGPPPGANACAPMA